MKQSIKKKEEIIQGKWWKIENKIKKRITAKYHKIKDWVMDPKGYFLIHLDRKNKIIKVGYCQLPQTKYLSNHNMTLVVIGKTAIEIVNTLIKENLISSLQHAADMGIELHKAELALNYNLEYIQDKNLKIY